MIHQPPKIRGALPVLLPMRIRPEPLPLAERILNPWTATALILALAYVLITPAFAQGEAEGRQSIASILLEWTPTLAGGFGFNVLISIMSMAIGTVLGVILGVLQVSPLRPIRSAAWLVTQFFRNSPWLVLLFYCILLIPFQIEIGETTIPFPGWIKATIGLSLPVMAYMSEYMRGAILSIPTGQWESAESLGFTRRQIMTDVILPQTVKRVLPSWMNLYAVLTMATPLVSIIGISDVMTLTRAALSAEGRVDLLIPMYLYILSWFFIYCYPISAATRRLERKFSVNT
ncbi:amino acid ABC transporter permease [Roseovarius aquimarinus]|uniref:Amino acid ABC transporter permease n=1 Tax=Roseovarius aquimarinus TaxID=1229156 RepID=A0ABW7IAW4_9RHOB